MLSRGNGSYLSSFDVTSRGKAPDGSCFGCQRVGAINVEAKFYESMPPGEVVDGRAF